MTKTAASGVALACVLASACTSSPMRALLGGQSLSIGDWSGTTSQGTPIAFTVSEDELVTTITLGYDFNGCSGSHTWSDVNARTAPDLTCIPGPCRGTLSSYRAFSHVDGAPGGGPRTQINGLFLPGDRAEGQVTFVDYPGCGTPPPVSWVATKR